MDARLDVHDLLGLEEGDAHVIRNAGGVASDDAIRSLAISQRLLGTREIVLIHHTDCGMLTFTDDEFKAGIQEETGLKPAWSAEAFADVSADVRQSIAPDHGEPVRAAPRPGAGLRLRRRDRAARGGRALARTSIRPGDLIRRRAKNIGPWDAARCRDLARRVVRRGPSPLPIGVSR